MNIQKLLDLQYPISNVIFYPYRTKWFDHSQEALFGDCEARNNFYCSRFELHLNKLAGQKGIDNHTAYSFTVTLEDDSTIDLVASCSDWSFYIGTKLRD